ncbi:MAG: hypothetical protein FWD57_01315 [Polyangiaceae bacterium]|nr:hypothetical protein [Polyangiaceae bacterium]
MNIFRFPGFFGAVVLSAIGLCALVGCGGSAAAPTATPSSREGRAAKSSSADGLATLVASVPAGTLGPYVGFGQGAMALYAPPREGGRRWIVQALDGSGSPVHSPYDIGPAPESVPFAVVRAVGGNYMLMWVRQVRGAGVLEGVLVGGDGSVYGAPTSLAQGHGSIWWADAVESAGGVTLLWVEQGGNGGELRRLGIGSKGEVVGHSELLVDGVMAWELATFSGGTAVALVVASNVDATSTPNVDSTLGTVKLLILDRAGKAKSPPIAVSEPGTARFDVGIVATQRGLLLAWTGKVGEDLQIQAAATNFQGKTTVTTRSPLPPLGDQHLVALVEPSREKPNLALLVYEQHGASNQENRELMLTTLSSDAVASSERAKLNFSSVGAPNGDFIATPDGFALLTGAPVCPREGQCTQIPWYVRLSTNMSVSGAGPVIVDALRREPPMMMWSPGCTSTNCLAMAVGSTDPALVAAVKLRKNTPPSGTPVAQVQSATVPSAVSNRTVFNSDDPISAFAATTVGSTTAIAWITDFSEELGRKPKPAPKNAPGDPTKPTAALLGVQRLDESGLPAGKPTVISVRALTPGGVGMAPHPSSDEVCVAWVAKDNGSPQVFVTRVGADGKTKAQRVITQTRGEAADVAIAPYRDGWVVGWVDWRDGNGEVYVVRVGPMLVKTGPEKRITTAAGDASSVSLLVVGDDILVAYADSRDDAAHGLANPYVQRLNGSTLERIGLESRLSASEHHTKWVQLSKSGGDVVLGWLTQPMPGADETGHGFARAARLDLGSLRLQGMVEIHASGPAPGSMGMSCEQGECRGAMVVPRTDYADIVGFSWFPSGPRVQRSAIARASGRSAAGVAPVASGSAVYFADQGTDGEDRLRRVLVRWKE